MHSVVYEHAESVSIGVLGVPSAADTFGLGVTAVYNLPDSQYERGYSRADPGYYGAAAELEQFVVVGVPSSGGCAVVGGDWSNPEGEIWRAIETLRRIRSRRCHEHVIGNPNWVAFY